MNYTEILKKTKDKEKLKITLRKTDQKGVSIFATKNISEGEKIAFYKIRIYKKNNYTSPTDFTYSFDVYRKNGEEYKRLIGDIDSNSFPPPENGIPYWGPFANEPSLGQIINSEIDINLKHNYQNRKYAKPGESMVYILTASRDIKPGEEIVWDYGPNYTRDYIRGK